MLKLVSDENFDGDILRGLYRRCPELDVVRAQDVGLSTTPNSDILAWAAAEGRTTLSGQESARPAADLFTAVSPHGVGAGGQTAKGSDGAAWQRPPC